MDLIPPLVCQIVLRAPQSLELWSCWLRGSLGIVRRKILSAPLLFIHGLLRPTGEGNCMAGKIKACAERGQGYF